MTSRTAKGITYAVTIVLIVVITSYPYFVQRVQPHPIVYLVDLIIAFMVPEHLSNFLHRKFVR